MTRRAASCCCANPFVGNDLKRGYGHEDWHWNQATIAKGIAHKPVSETIHFKRRRVGSQSDLVDKRGGVTWPMHRHPLTT